MAYPISNDVLNLFKSQYRQTIRVSVAGQSKSIELSETDIIQQGFSLSRYCVSGSTLEIGSAIASEVDITLNNKDGRFSGFSFEGAELFVEIGIKKWDARKWEKAVMHYVPLGYFTVDNSPRKSQIINLVALDRMMQFARKVDRSQLLFPMTVATLVRAICSICGITLVTDVDDLPNSSYVIPNFPEEENLTYRQLLQWAAMMTATCAYIDWEGKLRLEWYKSTNPTRLTPGDRYVPSDLSEKAITITGVELVTEDDQAFICGEEGYTLVIEGNKLIQNDYENVLLNIYSVIGDFTYRPYSCNTKPHPHLFPMDKIEWVDADGNTIHTILTTYSFGLNTTTALAAKGETGVEAGYASGNPLTAQEKTIINQTKTEINTEITERHQAILQLNETIANSLGLYETRISHDDGSMTFYYHNKSTLGESTTIYTHTADGYAWTSGENCWNNGNPVWQYGYTKEGNAVYNALSAFKISTDLLDARSITTEKIAIGAIGGFTVDSEHIGHGMTSYNDAEHDGVYLSPTGIGLGKGKFYVTPQGFLHAESGEFTGDIKGGTININENFKVDADGNVALNGSISWGTGSSPTQVVYARSSITKPSNNTLWSSFPNTSSSGWHKTFNSSYDKFASYTYDGGVTWGTPIKIVGTDGVDGVDGTDGVDGSDASVTAQNVFNALTNDGTKFGCFTDSGGKLYINAEYIKAGTVSSNLTFTGKLVADDARISGNITASSGRIGGWYIGVNDGYLRTASGTYGTYQWTTTGTDLKYATGYAFVALTPQGVRYILKSGSDYDNSATIVETSSFLNSSGGTITPGDGGVVII